MTLHFDKQTERQKKKKKEALRELKRQYREDITQQESKRIIPKKPRYDEVFFKGLEWLDSLAGKPIPADQKKVFDIVIPGTIRSKKNSKRII